MSTRRVHTLGDAIRHGLMLEVICTGEDCGRHRTVSPHQLLKGTFPINATLAEVGRRMRCRGDDLAGGGCGHRGAIVRAVFEPSPPPDRPGGDGGNVVEFPLHRRAEGSAPVVRRARTARRRAKRVARRQR